MSEVILILLLGLCTHPIMCDISSGSEEYTVITYVDAGNFKAQRAGCFRINKTTLTGKKPYVIRKCVKGGL